MKFIFPQNYKFKNKILGIIDYSTAFINLIWYAIVLLLVNLLFRSINLKVIFFVALSFPLLLFSISGFHGESIITVARYLIKFIFMQKLFFYNKM